MLARMDALEMQVARLTSQNEELANRLRQIEGGAVPQQAAAASAAAHDATAAAGNGGRDPAPLVPEGASTPPGKTVTAGNLAAMTGGASAKPDAPKPEAPKPDMPPATGKPAESAKPAVPAKSSAPAMSPAKRLAAVKAVVKPQTADSGDDEFTYGFRLYDARLYPEAAQQLRMYLDKYPRHADASKARNLLGRALLDDGKPRDAAPWFLQNYKADPKGARAADSLLGLAQAMHELGDNNRACVALGEFATNYPADARGRLKGAYEQTRAGVSCN
jgi:TolA-binding protein